MSAAARARALPSVTGQEFADVLSGVVLDGPAGRLAVLLEPAFLTGAGWDPVTRVLSPPAGHQLLGRQMCRAGGCTGRPHAGRGVCRGCFARLTAAGMLPAQITAAEHLPPDPARHRPCLVAGCVRSSSNRGALCVQHARQFRSRARGLAMKDFLADPLVRPLGPAPACAVAACAHLADGCRGWCRPHYARWRAAAAACPGLDAGRWQLTEPPIPEGGHVSLHGLPPLVMVQVLFGVWRRAQDGVKTGDISLRMACRVLAGQQVATVEDCQVSQVASKAARALLRSFARDVRRALADPAAEQAGDVWDLAVFGHRGWLDFAGITQPWLREAAKRWAAQDLPRRRGKGHSNVRTMINATARLSESLRARPDHGTVPSALSRRDAENFLNRLGYLESQGTISRYQRNKTCTSTRAVLTGIRALGLTRPGQPAAGLPGDVILTAADIPTLAERGEPGRDLPPEIMAALCAGLDQLEPTEVRAAVQIAIDTGRRPEDITGLPLDCLALDAGGAPVLIYDNAKAGRRARRLPVSQDTAQVIIAQQQRVNRPVPWHPPRRTGAAAIPAPQSRRAPAHKPGHAGRTAPRLGRRPRPAAHRRRRRVRSRQDRALRLPAHLRPAARRSRRPHRRPRRAPRSPRSRHHPRLLPCRRGPPPRRGRQGHRHAVRPARQPDLARRPHLAERRARPLRRRVGRRPLRHLLRAVQRRRRRGRLPGPVPLRRLRPLPYRRVLPARPDRSPR